MRRAVNRIFPLSKNNVLNHQVVRSLKVNFSNVEEFYIALDEPHRIYKPCEKISGEVVLQLKRDMANVAIHLVILGAAKIKSSNSPSTLRNTRKASLFTRAICIYGGSENEDDPDSYHNGLTKGEHRFPFVVTLPKENIFTSISFEKGSIIYSFKATISDSSEQSVLESQLEGNLVDTQELNGKQRVTKLDGLKSPIMECEKYINVLRPINVSRLPKLKPKTLVVNIPSRRLMKTISSSSTINSTSSAASQDLPGRPKRRESNTDSSSPNSIENGGAIKSDPKIKLTVSIAEAGYLRGESIPINIKLNHVKKMTNTNGIVLTFLRICRIDFGPVGAIQSFRKDLSQCILPLLVNPVTLECEASTNLRIPSDVFPTIVGCELVSFQYYIEVLVNCTNAKGASQSSQSQATIDKGFDDENLARFRNSRGKYLDTENQRGIRFQLPEEEQGVKPNYNNPSSGNIFNVDKLKRMKNVLSLTTEIVIGTERRKTKRRGRRSEIDNHFSSSSPIATDSPLVETPISTDTPIDSPADQAFPSTPPYDHLSPPPLPNSENHSASPRDEKTLHRLHEEALLPSEPVFDDRDPQESPHAGSDYDIDFVPAYFANPSGEGNHTSKRD